MQVKTYFKKESYEVSDQGPTKDTLFYVFVK